MKRLLTFFFLCSLLLPAGAQQLAFPGADGYAKYITGGRGGKVYYVTSLKDCTDDNLVPGTLRWALRTGDDTPRTILFAVNGTIYLESKLKTTHNNVSILGQSAPGGGICITGYPVYISNRNYIVRYIRFRAGEVPALENDGNVSFCALDIENAAEILLDHCSITWSMEECLTMFDNEVTTVQHCIIGEGLYHSYNVKTSGESSGRSFAMQWGGEKSNMHHVLITNCNGRAPRFNGVRGAQAWLPGEGKTHAHDVSIDGDFANNVIHNWGGGGTSYYGGEMYQSLFADAPADVNAYNRVYMRNNYFRPGPATQEKGKNSRFFMNPSGNSSKEVGEWYLEGNKFEKNGIFTPSGTYWSAANIDLVNDNNLYGFGSGENYSARALNLSQSYASHILSKIPYELSGYKPVSAEQAFREVTDGERGSGANLPRYDEVDKRLVDEAAGRIKAYFKGSRATNASEHPGIIDDPYDIKLQNGTDVFTTLKGITYKYCPSLALREGEKYAVDSDADGMPDAYEEAKGLDPRNAADGSAVAQNGYTNLENYLNGIADFSIKNSDYQTSATYVEPGLATRPERVTVTFAVTDSSVEGVAPSALSAPYGQSLSMPSSNSTLYKEGYTMTGWTDGNMTYSFGQPYSFVEDITLTPQFKKNIASLSERFDEVTLRWELKAGNPDLSKKGVFVQLQEIEGEEIDMRFLYDAYTVTLPACEGATATITYPSGKETFTAVNGVLEKIAVREGATAISVKMPYVVNIPEGTVFHTPQIPDGQRAEIVYTNLANLTRYASERWVTMTGTPSERSRHSIDPETDEFTYYTYDDYVKKYGSGDGFQLSGIQVGSYLHSDGVQRTIMYVKDCGKVRTYVAGSNSNGDYVQLTAIATDGSGTMRATHSHVLNKYPNYSESFDMELDPDKAYILVFSSVQGYDMVVTAVKLFDKDSGTPATGEVTAAWEWTGYLMEEGVISPATVLSKAAYAKGDAVKSAQVMNYMASFKGSTTAENDQQYIEFTLTPSKNMALKMQTMSFYAYSVGAQAKIRITRNVEGVEKEIFTKDLLTATNETRENSTYTVTLDATETMKSEVFRLYFSNLSSRYSLRMSNVLFTGSYEKRAADDPGIFSDGPYHAIVSNAEELQQALVAAAQSKDDRYYIFLKNGDYDFGTTALTTIPKNTSLIGESTEGVLIHNNPGNVTDYQNQTPVLFIAPETSDVYLQDLTVRQARDWAEKVSQGQAIAIRQRGKRVIYRNVTVQGVQDTYYLNKADASAYFENCTLAGEVDFIYGDGTMFFENCVLHPVSSKAVITAPNTPAGGKGIVFNGCRIEKTVEAKDDVTGYRLGRPWNDSPAATYINTVMAVLPTDAGWGKMTDNLVVRFREYGSKDAKGNTLDLSCRSVAACNAAEGSLSPVMTSEEAAVYTVANVFGKVASGWTPDVLARQLTAPQPVLSGMTLTWNAVEGAYCYAIVQDGKVVDFTTSTSFTVPDTSSQYAIRVANAMGGLSAASPTATTGIENIVIDNSCDAPRYNLSGQRVSRNAKGIVIYGGKKVLEVR